MLNGVLKEVARLSGNVMTAQASHNENMKSLVAYNQSLTEFRRGLILALLDANQDDLLEIAVCLDELNT